MPSIRPVDAIYLHMEQPDNLMYVTGILLLDDAVEVTPFKQLIEERFLKFGRFKQKLKPSRWALSDWRWVNDPDFDIDNHIHERTLAAPDQATLEAAISAMVQQPLDRSMPLWQIDLLHGHGERGGTAIVVRLHHVIADGIALVYVLLQILESEKGWQMPGQKSGLWNWLKGFFGRIYVFSKLPFTIRRMLKTPPDPDTALRGQIGLEKRVAWMPELPLADIKAIGKAYGATINDMVLTMLTGSIRSYLAARGEPVDEFDINVAVPVAMRKLEKSAELGNVIGAVTLTLPINLTDRQQQLKTLHKRMNKLKRSPEAWVSYRGSKAIGMMPRKRASNAIANARKKTSMLVSNVPGPRSELTLLGQPVKRFVFYGPMTGRLPIAVSILSYNGGVTVGVFADVNVIDAPDEILAGFQAEYEWWKEQTTL